MNTKSIIRELEKKKIRKKKDQPVRGIERGTSVAPPNGNPYR